MTTATAKELDVKPSQIEMDRFAARTPKSRAQLERGKQHFPLGVTSNFRFYPPHPIYVREARGARLWDLDGNEYLDHNMCFGVMMPGHANPIVLEAVAAQVKKGTMYGMPYELEQQLAAELQSRFPVLELLRYANSGTEATMHALRVARGFTGRERVIKMEGAYHGVHDTALISYKPALKDAGDPKRPTRVPASGGIPAGTAAATIPCTMNDLEALETCFRENRGQVAAMIVEPIMMNIGVCLPDPGFYQAALELCHANGALFIFDEVKTGVKLARGGACEHFGIKPDMITLGKAIGGGFPLAAFGGRRDVMDVLTQGKVFHAGTYNANTVGVAAGYAALTRVYTPEVYARHARLNQALVDGYNDILKREGLMGYAAGAGCNGTVMFSDRVVKNYRDWCGIHTEMWKTWFYGLLARGVVPQAYAWDEQWTFCVAHTEADVELHLAKLRELVPALKLAQDQPRA
jgi:glutamate-1-semialdehyde 2,1-aminomutase